MFKTLLDKLGTILGVFWILKIFLKHFEDSTLFGTLGKKISRKNYPKTCWKHVWTLLRTILGIFGILQIFWFFETISKTRRSMEHWAKKISEENTPKHVQNTFGCFWERFWTSFEFWKIFKNVSQTRPSMEHWAKKNSRKNSPKNMLKTLLDKLGTILGIFRILKNFSKTFRGLDPLWNTGQKKFLEKITPKNVENTFGHFWERFWAFLEFCKFSKNILKTRPSLEHWTKNSRKIYPKIRSKHFSTLLGTILRIFGVLRNFWFFKNISKTRHSLEHWA